MEKLSGLVLVAEEPPGAAKHRSPVRAVQGFDRRRVESAARFAHVRSHTS